MMFRQRNYSGSVKSVLSKLFIVIMFAFNSTIFLIPRKICIPALRRLTNGQRKVARRTLLPLSGFVALFYVGYRQYDRRKEIEERKAGIYRDIKPFGPWRTRVYVSYPRNLQSRFWGYVHNLPLPMWLREPIYRLYIHTYQVDIDEAKETDLKKYANLSEFFRRPLKPEVRPIAQECLVSPVDGRVDLMGEVTDGLIEQVKGLTYEISTFFGEDVLKARLAKMDPNKRLMYCVIYLAPGDYHAFHSPADWRIKFRRHFSGYLLGVSQRVTQKVANLFCINERVILMGDWTHGFFSMTAVGATNVGNIGLDFEENLITNRRGRKTPKCRDMTYAPDIEKKRGDRVGEFRIGSTVVLIFEAPKNFTFTALASEKIKYGQSLGRFG